MKLSPRKITQPGAKHVYRGPGSHLLTLYGEPAPTGWKPLLIQVMRDGRRVTGPEPPDRVRERRTADVLLPATARASGPQTHCPFRLAAHS